MLRHLVLALTLVLYSVSPLFVPDAAIAQTRLTRGVIESLRNRVRLIRRDRSARAARRSDAIAPGDALATAANSTVDVRFNDRSLARLGEQAVFRFSPGMRTVDLTRGTLILLVSPGQGRTGVRTPNAAAGIRGSALFVRYIPETDTTLLGALTNSGIEVFDRSGTERLELEAGQMAVMVEDRIDRVYNFDLDTFYQTSPLMQDLDLTEVDETASPDEPMNQIRAEVREGLETQDPIPSAEALVNPDFMRLPPAPATPQASVELQDFPAVPDFNATVVNLEPNLLNGNSGGVEPNIAAFQNPSDARSLLVGAETQASIGRSVTFPAVPGNFPTGNVPGGTPTVAPLPGGNPNVTPSGGRNRCNISLPIRGNRGRGRSRRLNICRLLNRFRP
ncbi:MAG: FecR family protein [Cyanobacteriota bacterium]|nr:FecR family protein [Cyanobacteriota bacterium]